MSNETPQLKIPRSAKPTPTDARLRNRPVPLVLYSAGSLVIIVAMIVGATEIGWFQTSGRTTAGGEKVELTASSTGADLKGWMTIQDVLDAFDISQEDFYTTFNLPADLSTSEKLGPLGESIEGFELELVRTWLDTRAGTTNDELQTEGSDQGLESDSTTDGLEPSEGASHEPMGSGAGMGTGEWADAEVQVRGRTTLDELVELTSSSRETLYQEFGIPLSVPGSTRLIDLESAGVSGVEVLDIRIWANS